MESPCKTCHRLPEDKNGPECASCEKRIAYVRRMASQPWGSESIMKIVQTAGVPMSPGPPAEKPRRTCTEPGCSKKHLAKGLCSKHYQQRRQKKKAGTWHENIAPSEARLFPAGVGQALWERIEKIAESELRSAENQMLYMLQKSCEHYEKKEGST